MNDSELWRSAERVRLILEELKGIEVPSTGFALSRMNTAAEHLSGLHSLLVNEASIQHGIRA